MTEKQPSDQPVPAPTKSFGQAAPGRIHQANITPEMVEERAKELAHIDGRDARHVTADDRRKARQELLQAVHPTSDDQNHPAASPADPAPGTTPHREPKRLPQDDQLTKELVEEGVDDAEHDQMIRARKEGK